MKAEIKHGLGREYYADGASKTNLDGAVSKSLLWKFHKSPFKWRYGPTEKPSDAMIFGQLVHALCFTPDNVDSADFVINTEFDSFRTKAAQEWKAEQEAAGKAVVSQADHQRALEIADCVMNTQELFRLGQRDYEVAVYSKLGATTIKGMIDIAPRDGDCLADLKTITSIESLHNLQRTVFQSGYHWQAALYLDLWNAATGENRTKFNLLFVEKGSPFETAWVTLSEEAIDLGRIGYMNAIAQWQNCVAKNHWPTTIQGVQEITVPQYMKGELQ